MSTPTEHAMGTPQGITPEHIRLAGNLPSAPTPTKQEVTTIQAIRSTGSRIDPLEALRAHVAEETAELRTIGERIATQDNRITDNPMFCVQHKRRMVGFHRNYSDLTVWILDGEEVEPETKGSTEYGFREQWETVMVAFTEEGCKEYLKLNGHNLREPRIYVESFNRCPEMVAIRAFLLSLPKPA